jgi:hypothetical protein
MREIFQSLEDEFSAGKGRSDDARDAMVIIANHEEEIRASPTSGGRYLCSCAAVGVISRRLWVK